MHADAVICVLVVKIDRPDHAEQISLDIGALRCLTAGFIGELQLNAGEGVDRVLLVDQHIDLLNLTGEDGSSGIGRCDFGADLLILLASPAAG